MGALQTFFYLVIAVGALLSVVGVSGYVALSRLRAVWSEVGQLEAVFIALAAVYALLFMLAGGLVALIWVIVRGTPAQ
jgi:hypothetical protein